MATTLASIMIELTGDDSRFNATMNAAVNRAQGMGSRAGSQFGSSFGVGFANPVLNAVSGINTAISGIQTIGAMALDISGMRTAAQFGDFRRQFAGITGDVTRANKVFERFVDLANTTNYDVPDIVSVGLTQAGRTGDAEGSVARTENLLNAAAAFGVKPVDFARFTNNLTQIEIMGDRTSGVVNRRQLLDAGKQAPAAIARALGVSIAEATRRIDKSTGNELTEMIRIVGESNRGLVQRQAAGDPLKVGANLIDSLKAGMEPTGRLFNTVITPVMVGIKRLADGLGFLNKMTGGSFGLMALIGGGIFAFRRFGGAVTGAVVTTNRLTAALTALARTEMITTGATTRLTTATGMAGMGGRVGGAMAGLAGAGAMAKDMAMYMPVQESQKGQEFRGNFLRSIGLGKFVDWVDARNGKPGSGGPTTAQDKHAKAMEKHAEALQTSTKLQGGGKMAMTSLSIVEREFATYQLSRGAQTGIG